MGKSLFSNARKGGQYPWSLWTQPLTDSPRCRARIFPATWRMVSLRRVRAATCGVMVIFGFPTKRAGPAGFLGKHVQRGATELPAGQRRQQIVLYQMPAAPR